MKKYKISQTISQRSRSHSNMLKRSNVDWPAFERKKKGKEKTAVLIWHLYNGLRNSAWIISSSIFRLLYFCLSWPSWLLYKNYLKFWYYAYELNLTSVFLKNDWFVQSHSSTYRWCAVLNRRAFCANCNGLVSRYFGVRCRIVKRKLSSHLGRTVFLCFRSFDSSITVIRYHAGTLINLFSCFTSKGKLSLPQPSQISM